MYFMTGTSIQPQNKYSVDEQEISRLQQMAMARKQSKHYGRGLSSKGDPYVSEIGEKESSKSFLKADLPQQPPPSSLSHVESLSPEEAALITEDMPPGGSRENNKLPPGGKEETHPVPPVGRKEITLTPPGGGEVNNKLSPGAGEESSVKKGLSTSRSLDEDSISMFDEQGVYEEHNFERNGDKTVPSGGRDYQKDSEEVSKDVKQASLSAVSSAGTSDTTNISATVTTRPLQPLDAEKTITKH